MHSVFLVSCIYGVNEIEKKPSQNGNVYTIISKTKQKEAVNWLLNNAFSNQNWLIEPAILNKIEFDGYNQKLLSYQTRHLYNLLSIERLGRLLDAEFVDSKNYKALELLTDVRKGIWNKNSSSEIFITERNIQKAHLERIISIYKDNKTNYGFTVSLSDVKSLVYGELLELKSYLILSKGSAKNNETKYHYLECIKRIENCLDNK